MSVCLVDQTIHVSGPSRVEDAEPLAALLQAARTHAVDLTGCGPLHAAVFQVLLAFRPIVIGPACDAFDEAWLVPQIVPCT